MDLECFDQTNAINGLMSVLMIIGGMSLMNGPQPVAPNLGSGLLALGFLVLALAILDRDVSSFKDARRALKGTRSMVVLISALSVVVGMLARHYHIQSLLAQHDDYRVVAALVQDLPVIYKYLINGGLAGLAVGLGMNKDGSVNYFRGGLGAAAVVAFYFASQNLNNAMATNDIDQINRAALLVNASLLLPVVAASYAC
jgi:hypothetical protein